MWPQIGWRGLSTGPRRWGVWARRRSRPGNRRRLRIRPVEPGKLIRVYDPDGSTLIAEFGEPDIEGTIAATPAKIHRSPYPGAIAVDDSGKVYVFDEDKEDKRRLAIFKPKTPGDYSEYEYAGEILNGASPWPQQPVLDDAGNIYTADEETVQKFSPAGAKLCDFTYKKGGITALTVNPVSEEPFFASYKELGKLHRLAPCVGGKFAEEAAVPPFAPEPRRGDVTAMAFNPELQWQAGRPAGTLYAGAALPCASAGTCAEPLQSGLGYVFAQASSAAEVKLSVAKTGTGAGAVTSTPAGIDCGATCATEFAEGEVVSLAAKADAGSSFAGWGGACAGAGACEVTMTEAKAVTAEFSKAGPAFHTLKVTVTGEGSVSADSGTISGCTSSGGAACEGSYEEGATVTLTETPDPGNLFQGWGTPQCDESTAETCVVTIGAGDEDVAAAFEAEPAPGIPLTVAVEGPGTVTSDVGLISCSPFCEDEYPEGTKVTLTASPNEGSLFMAWKHCDAGGINGRQCTVTMSKAKAVSAVFGTAHALTVAKAEGSGAGKIAASGGISCPYACEHASALLKEGAAVTVKQTPAKHFHFAGWEGDCAGTGACVLSMGEDHEVSADFEEDPKLSLSLTKTGGGQALVKSKPAGLLCAYTCFEAESSFYEGEAITVSWKLGKGTTKLSWSEGAGTCTGTSEALEGSCTVSMSAATELAATLE